MRESLAVPATQLRSAPGVIDLGIGQPQDAMLPVTLMARAMSAAAGARLEHPLQYGVERGDGRLRVALADFLTERYGTRADPEQLLITNGNSQAIDLCCAAFTQPGDVVFVEEPTYFLALRIFADHGLRVVGIPMDDDGLRIDVLEAELARHSPRLLYTIPTGHNPTGSSMSLQRRRRLAELARDNEFLVVADEVYQMLVYTESAHEPLAAQVDTGAVLSLGTFSKILAPGLRLGWIQASDELLNALATRGQLISGGGLNPMTGSLVAPILRDGGVGGYLDTIREIFRSRITTLDEALRGQLPTDASYRVPDAGYFFWLRFPGDVDTALLRPAAAAAGVGFQPGRVFSTNGGSRNCLRLSISYYDDADIRAAATSLCRTFGDSTR